MRILFIAHRIPFPPDKGDKIRSFHELQALAAAGHEVHLLAFADNARDRCREYTTELLRSCASVGIHRLDRRAASVRALAALVRGAPFSLGYFSSRAMRTAVERACASIAPHAIVVYSSSVAQYVPQAFDSRTLLDMVDVDSEKWRDYSRIAQPPWSWVYATEARRLWVYEQTIIRKLAYTVVTTPRERDILTADSEAAVSSRVEAVASGVDLRRFSVDYTEPRPDAAGLKHMANGSRAPLVVFTGAMDYYANVDAATHFVLDVWPAVRARVPDAEFIIVGSNPTAAVVRLGKAPGVTVTGTVPDVRPYVAAAAVCVAPLRIARGVQNKILEAMAMGRAVVSTLEAAAGLSAVAGADLLVGRSAQEFADAVVSIITDGELRNRLGRQARTFVESNHEWAHTLRRFVDIVGAIGGADSRIA